MIVFRLAIAVFAVIMVVFGVIAMLAPTPFGFVFIILGFLLLTIAAPALVRRLRRHGPWLDRRLNALEKKAPGWLARRLRESGPPQDQEDEEDEQTRADRAESPESDSRRNGAQRQANPLARG